MRPPCEPRFTRGEAWVHRATAALVGVLFATGAVLYNESLALAVGRRPLVEGLHIAAGLLLPLPTLVGLWASAALRADVGRLNRLPGGDKFNGGQKLASAVIAGAGLVLFGTGLLLIAPARINLPIGLRQGATITHDTFTLGLLILLAGHIWEAWRHPEARAALRAARRGPTAPAGTPAPPAG